MPGLNDGLNTSNTCNVSNIYNRNDSDSSNLLWILMTFVAFMMLVLTLLRLLEGQNRLNYEHRLTRIIAGFIQVVTRVLHAKQNTLDLPEEGPTLIAVGPHRTGFLDAVSLATQLKGNPPRFLATDGFNKIPGVSSVLSMFKTIPVKSTPKTIDNGNHKPANSNAIEAATKALQDKGCVALFPQGSLCIGKDSPMIYPGAARLAIQNKIPIHVVRLDGYWSINNWLLPMFVRNNRYYRAFLSSLHLNNIQTILCCVIDLHLKPENSHMTNDEMINEISAQLYAYFRHIGELTPKQIAGIKEEIASGKHREIWDNKASQYGLERQLKGLKEEHQQLDQEISKQYQLSPSS